MALRVGTLCRSRRRLPRHQGHQWAAIYSRQDDQAAIREAVEDYAALRGLDMDLEKAFGKAATAEEVLPSGTLFFTNATLKEDEAESILSNHVEDLLYINKVATAIDEKNGITQEHSLRTIETTIPCTLYATILYVDDDMESVLEAALGFIKHMGTGRNRGLGRCKFSIEKGGKA